MILTRGITDMSDLDNKPLEEMNDRELNEFLFNEIEKLAPVLILVAESISAQTIVNKGVNERLNKLEKSNDTR